MRVRMMRNRSGSRGTWPRGQQTNLSADGATKQHYEKVILGLAMLALVYSAYIVWTDDSEGKIEKQVQAREPDACSR